ncbi:MULTISPECIES: hypothetical protein [unclassified Kribbella]|uniref:hypothetical protein n=1 Tax=unclassified Kribbella TaxID=2644121 RepID=UPI003018B5FD
MADPKAEALLRKLNDLVRARTRRPPAAPDARLPELNPMNEWLFRQLADNLDIPARLAPTPAALLNPGTWESRDRQAGIRAAMTQMVAACAENLEPNSLLPAPEDQGHRDRLGAALSEAFAVQVTPEVVPGLMPNGRPGDLGVFTPPVLEGDPAAARALALAIGARTRQTDEQVLTALVGAGRGGAAPAAARMLLDTKPRFATLPRPEQEAVVGRVAQELETRFASRDLSRAQARKLTEEVENRREDITGGATAVDEAGKVAAEEIRDLHELMDKLPASHRANQARAAAEALASKPESVPQLFERVQGAVGELTGAPGTLWNGQIEQMPPEGAGRRIAQSRDGTIFISAQTEAALQALTGPNGRLDPEQVADARAGLQAVSGTLAQLAVPEDHTAAHEAAADTVSPRFKTLSNAVSQAFSEDCLNEIVKRTLPPEIAQQLTAPEPPQAETRFAPAARGLASAVDAAADRPAGETLRRMAGEGRSGMSIAAAEVVVSDSAIPKVQRPFAVAEIAESIDKGFDDLPTAAAAWGDDAAGQSRTYGENLGQQALSMAREFEPPGQDATTRFLPGLDPAVSALDGVDPQAARPGTAANAATANEGKSTGLDSR